MGYSYNFGETNFRVTAGYAAVSFGRVIQRPDAYGGYNVTFSVPGETDIYHVHFFAGGCRVSVVRHKASSGAEGSNIIKYVSGTKKNLSGLAHECANFANHFALLTNLSGAVAGVGRTVGNEIA